MFYTIWYIMFVVNEAFLGAVGYGNDGCIVLSINQGLWEKQSLLDCGRTAIYLRNSTPSQISSISSCSSVYFLSTSAQSISLYQIQYSQTDHFVWRSFRQPTQHISSSYERPEVDYSSTSHRPMNDSTKQAFRHRSLPPQICAHGTRYTTCIRSR